MDSITHILSAALWTEPIPQPELGDKVYARWRERGAVLMGALLPDADGVLGWIDPALFARYHRVVTHSILGMGVIVALCSVISAKWPERVLLPFLRPKGDGVVVNPSARRLAFFAAIAIVLHFVGDWIAAWGIWPLWPFSNHDFAMRWVNSLDPVLLAITVSFWAAQHVCLTHGRRRAGWALAGLWFVACAGYVAARYHWGPAPFV